MTDRVLSVVDVIHDDQRWREMGIDDLATDAFRATLQRLALDGAYWEISLLACDDAKIATLNADFRGKPQPTNVLSWPACERGADVDGGEPKLPDPQDETADDELGDIAIAYDTCAREAEAASKPFGEHVAHLIVHGVLHLLGYDHERDADATLMEGLETQILGNMGLSDPYRD